MQNERERQIGQETSDFQTGRVIQPEEAREIKSEIVLEAQPDFESEAGKLNQDINLGVDHFADNPPNNTELEYDRSVLGLFKQVKREIDLSFVDIMGKQSRGEPTDPVQAFQDLISKVRNLVSGRLPEHLERQFDEQCKAYEQELKKAAAEESKTKAQKLKALAFEAVDFIPVAGSAKMLAEGLYGKTMSGEELSKTKRVIHSVEGAVFLAVDLTGMGAIASTGIKGGRLITRSAALMRMVGMPRQAYTAVFKAGRFALKNPETAKLADKTVERVIKYHKARKGRLVRDIPSVVFSKNESEIEREEQEE